MPAVGASLGPYTILAPLGAGGMGEVYRARDTRLARDVAIKFISAEFTRDPERLKRFDREARAAGALNHPNVCTIHDVGTYDGAPYVVMELLEGESLRALLRAGPLSIRKALDYATQIAHGLAAAHAKGVVHRDLKPENLFVTRDGRVKVLDFGLAKLTQAEVPSATADSGSSLAPTESGVILGTTGYMAPEQVRGEAADARSDLFALGAILYELLTGRRAFGGASFVETAYAILNTEPPSIGTLRADASPALESIVRRCLEKRPEERFQNASDLAFALGTPGEATRPGAAASAASPTALSRRRLASPAAALALTILAAVVLAVAWRVFPWVGGRSAGPAEARDPSRIVVAVFENQTGDRSLDPLGRMASDWITQGLSRVEGVEVAPSTSVLAAQPAPAGAFAQGGDPIRTLAEKTGAGIVVSGDYYLESRTLRFQARITDAAHGKVLQSLEPVSGRMDSPLAAIDSLRQKVMGALASRIMGAPGSDRAGSTVYDRFEQRPPRYDAYREFILGFELFGNDDDEALRHFARAVELDPGFLTPMFYEAYLRNAIGDHARVDSIIKTLSARRDELPALGRHWLITMVAFTSHHYPEALKELRAAEKIAPRDPMVVLWIGYMARLSNLPGETVTAYRDFGPQPWPGHKLGFAWTDDLTSALHVLGQYRRELEEVQQARRLSPEALDLCTWEARALAALGRTAEIDRLIDACLAASPAGATAGDVMLTGAIELRAHGRREASIALATRAAAWYRDRSGEAPGNREWRSKLVDALRWGERWADAYAICAASAGDTAATADELGIRGALAARLGRRDEAIAIAGELQRMGGPHLYGSNTYRRALIFAVLGDRQRGLDLLRESLAEGRGFSLTLHREIDLEPLAGYAPFHELLRPKG